MKPIVASAACAERAPKAVPRVRAALPCNRCRREILPKSMCLLLGGWTAANSRLRRSGGARNLYRNLHATALLISITSHRIEMYDLYWLERSGLKLVQAWEGPKFQRHFWIVCKGVKQFSTPDSAVSIQARADSDHLPPAQAGLGCWDRFENFLAAS